MTRLRLEFRLGRLQHLRAVTQPSRSTASATRRYQHRTTTSSQVSFFSKSLAFLSKPSANKTSFHQQMSFYPGQSGYGAQQHGGYGPPRPAYSPQPYPPQGGYGYGTPPPQQGYGYGAPPPQVAPFGYNNPPPPQQGGYGGYGGYGAPPPQPNGYPGELPPALTSSSDHS